MLGHLIFNVLIESTNKYSPNFLVSASTIFSFKNITNTYSNRATPTNLYLGGSFECCKVRSFQIKGSF